ncbi:hypothetical protein BGW38_002841, partial [Lunasporangiospora selenospora]
MSTLKAKSSKRKSDESLQKDVSKDAPPAKKPVFSIFEKPSAKVPPASIIWETHGTSFIVGRAYSPQTGSNIAGFDLDQTLIKVNGKHKWPKNADDWVWWSPKVPARLKELSESGHTLVLVTNQNGLEGNVPKQEEMKLKLSKICGQLQLPMWILINRSQSYYVGDAAGRHQGWKVGALKDFNNTDRKFAATLEVDFYTPEDFFLSQSCPDHMWDYGPFNPKTWPKDSPLFSPTLTPLLPASNSCEMILFVGYPASGKSSFAKKHVLSTNRYEYVNQDTLKTKDKCLKAAEESLKNSKSVVIDNTNADKATRAPYIALAKKYNIPVRCFLFMVDKHLAVHNNYFRAFHRTLVELESPRPSDSATDSDQSASSSSTPKTRDEAPRDRLSEMVFAGYTKRYQEPAIEEGFSEIKNINFVPDEETRE